MEEKLKPALVSKSETLLPLNSSCAVKQELLKREFVLSAIDLHVLDRAKKLRRRDSPLVRRAHAIPSELLPAWTNATQPVGETATAARE